MRKRTALSKRVRFEVFKRDGFRCTYCGATPADSPLHVDHVTPVSRGGSDDPDNLVTACSGCNLGKGAVELGDRLPSKIVDEAQREQAEQIREYLAVHREIRSAKREVAKAIAEQWEAILGCELDGAEGRFMTLLNEFSPTTIMEAIDITAGRLGRPFMPRHRSEPSPRDIEDRARYFYGVLRNRRLAREGR